MTIGDRIREKRKIKEYTLEQLADEIGVTKSTVLKYENGSIAIPSDKIEKLAKSLNVSPAYLMGWDDGRKFRNKFFHNDTSISDEEKINFLKNVEEWFKQGMTSDEISKNLEFPGIEKIILKIASEPNFKQLLKTDKELVNFLTDFAKSIIKRSISFYINTYIKRAFENINLSIKDENTSLKKEILNQIMTEINIKDILDEELNKYRKMPDETFNEIKVYAENVEKIIKECKKEKKYPFDIVYSDGKVIEIKKINKDIYFLTFNINDDPIEIEYYNSPFTNVSEKETLYKVLLESNKNFFNSPNFSLSDKEKFINELQEEFFKVKFNINEK